MKLKKLAIAASILLASVLAMPAQTKSSSAAKKTTTTSTTSGGDKYEIELFGGANFPSAQSQSPFQRVVNGGVGGFRVTENIWNYVSLEQTGMVHGVANLQWNVPGTADKYSLGARLRQFQFNPVFHFTPREARIRPFVTAGFGFDFFGVTDDARRQVGTGQFTPFKQVVNLESQFKPAFNYGGGVKAKMTDRIGLRFDIRGISTASPDYGVPTSGPANAILYTRTTPLNSLQTTAGITLYLGPIETGPVCTFVVGSIDPSTKTVWVGESASYQLPVSNDCMGVTPKYKWTVDGNPVTGDSMLALTGLAVGTHAIKSVVEADTSKVVDKRTRNFLKKMPIAAAERSATLIVNPTRIELISLTADPTTINMNSTSRITSVISYEGPDAGETVTMTYKADAGVLSPTNPGNGGTVTDGGKTLTQSVKLKPGNTNDSVFLRSEGFTLQPGGPSRNIDVSLDAANKTLRATLKVLAPAAPAPVVTPPAPPRPQPMQLDDVVFAKGNARVNNCGKRILDQAFERAAAMGDFDVLLVGHYDAVEKNIKVKDVKAKKTRSLDEERVLQVAAVLSAGTEPCKRLERNRIKVAYVGAEQLSAFKTSLCEATVKELASGKISPADGSTKNRRVEIWLVPKSGPMPNGIGGIMDAPASEIQTKGCPK